VLKITSSEGGGRGGKRRSGEDSIGEKNSTGLREYLGAVLLWITRDAGNPPLKIFLPQKNSPAEGTGTGGI